MSRDLPNGFVLDDDPPEGYVVDEPPSKYRRYISGANRTYAGIAGLPVDMAAAALNYNVPGYKPTVETPLTNPVGGSGMIRQGMGAAGIDLNQPRDFWGMLGEYTAPAPIAGPVNAVRGAATPFGRIAEKYLGSRVGPVVGETARELVAGAAATAGGMAGQQVGQKLGSDSPFWEMGGSIVPAALASGASGVPKWLTRGNDPSVMRQRIAELEAQGIPYTRALATGNADQMASEAKLAANPGAYEVMRDVGRRADEAFGATTERIGGGPNSSVDSAGTLLKGDTIQGGGLFGKGGWYDRFKGQANKLYSALDAKIPPRTPVISTNTGAFLGQYATVDPRAPNLSAGGKNADILKMAEEYAADTQANLGQLPYERLKDLRTRVGQKLEITDTSVLGSADRAAMKQLYGALSKDMEEVARVSGATREFKTANRYYSQGATRAEEWLDNLNKKVKPEDFWRAAINDKPQSATQLLAYKRMLKPEEWDYMVQTTMNRWGKIQPGQETIAHDFALNRWYTNWNAAPDEVRTALLGKKGTPKRDAAELMSKNMDKYRESNQVLFNSSGTGATGLGASVEFGAAGGVAGAVLGYFTGVTNSPGEMALAAAAGTAGSIQGAKLIQRGQANLVTNEKFVKWLAKGVEMPLSRLPGHLIRLSAIAQKDTELEPVAKDLIRALDPQTYAKVYGIR